MPPRAALRRGKWAVERMIGYGCSPGLDRAIARLGSRAGLGGHAGWRHRRFASRALPIRFLSRLVLEHARRRSVTFPSAARAFTTGVVDHDAASAMSPVGTTANSLAPSAQPPLISVWRRARGGHARRPAHRPGFIINILSAGRKPCRAFAGPARTGSWRRPIGSPRGLVILEGTLAHLECERYAEFEAGDHTIFVGRVVEGEVAEGRPLIYYRGGYTELGRP
jgi:flavin reductase (DIM6/NTAB) family NADH-FMN oxidoreductase RutF